LAASEPGSQKTITHTNFMEENHLKENNEADTGLDKADEEVNSLVNDTEQSKRRRIEIVHSWPSKAQFEIEKIFSEKLQSLSIPEAFRPVSLNYSNEKFFQRSIAYMLDALDFLPYRPDLAFDFIWRAIDFLTSQTVSEQGISCNNDKDILRASVDTLWTNYFKTNPILNACFLKLIQCVPVQSCEYLFKRLYANYDASKPNNPNKEISRLIAFDGGAARNLEAKQVIELIRQNYPYDGMISRRKGSRFLFRYIKGDELTVSDGALSKTISANLAQQLNFCINGILYTLRNDRAHGGVFSPFRSSKATLRTYAHCGFSFLLAYYLLLALIDIRDDKLINKELLINNYHLNIELFTDLYGRNLKR